MSATIPAATAARLEAASPIHRAAFVAGTMLAEDGEPLTDDTIHTTICLLGRAGILITEDLAFIHETPTTLGIIPFIRLGFEAATA